MKGIAICGNCARQTRANEASSLRSRWSGNGNSPQARHQHHGIPLQEQEPLTADAGAPHQRLGELGYIERGNLGPVAAQAGQRAGIALALRGFELDFIIVAEPQFGLPVGGLAQRRQFDLLDGPAGLLQPLGGIPDRGLDLRNGFQTVGRDIHRHPLRHRRPFQRRRHPPGIAHILTRHRRQRDPEIADGARQRARDRATLRRKPPFRYRCVARRDPAGGRPQSVNAAGIGRKADRAPRCRCHARYDRCRPRPRTRRRRTTRPA